VEVPLSNTVVPVGLRDETVTHEHEERCVGVIPQKKHSLCHPIGGLDIKRRKYRSIHGLDRMNISTQPHTAASAFKPGCNRTC
jgi:hypothetical protein